MVIEKETLREFKIEFEIQGLPKMMNDLLRGHWTKKHAHTLKWKKLVTQEVYNLRPLAPLQRATLTLTRVTSKKPDYDGLVSSFKHVIDGLVEAKIIIDDTQEIIGVPTYVWEKGPPKQGKIKVEVLNNEKRRKE